MKKSKYECLEDLKEEMEKEIEKRNMMKSTLIANADARAIPELTMFEEEKISMLDLGIREAMEIIDSIDYLIGRIEDFNKI